MEDYGVEVLWMYRKACKKNQFRCLSVWMIFTAAHKGAKSSKAQLPK